MKKVVVAAALAAGTAVAVWAYRHPPFHLPGPILDNPIAMGGVQPQHRLPWHLPSPILDNPIALDEPPLPPRHLTKVISASACALVNGFTWNGPGVTATYGAILVPAGDFIINPNPPNQGPSTPYTQPDTLLLFCDARLPTEAVAFDFAELEYFAADEYGNRGPELDAYLDSRATNSNGYIYDQTMPLGSCVGDLSQLYRGTNPVSLCATDAGQSFYPDAGVPGWWPGMGWGLFSVHFIVSIPPSPDPALPNIAYRVIVHYEAP